VWPQLTHRSHGRELGQEGMCNRVRDRYGYKVAHTLAQATRSSRCGHQLCKQHERSHMWYQRELIKNMYSTTAYAGLTARRDLPRFIVYHSDVMWPYYSPLHKAPLNTPVLMLKQKLAKHNNSGDMYWSLMHNWRLRCNVHKSNT
jgi:hypothetical protein